MRLCGDFIPTTNLDEHTAWTYTSCSYLSSWVWIEFIVTGFGLDRESTLIYSLLYWNLFGVNGMNFNPYFFLFFASRMGKIFCSCMIDVVCWVHRSQVFSVFPFLLTQVQCIQTFFFIYARNLFHIRRLIGIRCRPLFQWTVPTPPPPPPPPPLLKSSRPFQISKKITRLDWRNGIIRCENVKCFFS